jgi:3-deoxy-D-manno-octulosonic-acid transferase
MQVADEQELEEAFDSLVSDPAKRQALGQAAQKVVQQNEGAVEKTVGMILDGMKSDGMVQQF